MIIKLVLGLGLVNISSSLIPIEHITASDHLTLSNLPDVIHHLDIQKYALQGAVAGGCRGLARGLTYPFDTIKTLEQVNRGRRYTRESGVSILTYISKLFSGVTPAVLSAVPANAVFFAVYRTLELITGTYHLTPFHSSLLTRIIITSIATFPQNSFKIPFEVVKQRMQTMEGASRLQVLQRIMSEHGPQGLFVGGNAQLLRELPYNAIQMTVFEYIREAYHSSSFHHLSLDELNLSALCGLFASFIAALLTQPADVIKTKIMAEDNERDDSNIVHIVKSIYKTEGILCVITNSSQITSLGWKGFFVGLEARLALVSIGGNA